MRATPPCAAQASIDETRQRQAAAAASAPGDAMVLETAEQPYAQDGAHLRAAGGGAGGEFGAKKWHLGVQSRMPPADMMLEVFRALRVVNYVSHRTPTAARARAAPPRRRA